MLAGSTLSPKTRPIYSKAVIQARELQNLLMNAANDPECTGPALAQIARAWSELEERKRVLRMRPAPKPVDVPLKKPSRRSSGALTGPVSMVPEPADPAPSAEPPKSS